jgi:fructokinase
MPARPTIVGIGEILWDMFPDGPQFGGAPANFACSVADLCGSDMDVYLVSGLGRDDLGRRAIELLHTHDVDTSFVSVVDRPTGQVLVQLDTAGQAKYEFAADAAWDNVAWSDELFQLAVRADAVCFGTLGQRSPISCKTIRRFLRSVRPECLRVLDINLRPPFWNKEVVHASFELANVLKLNDTELEVLADLADWKRTDDELLQALLTKNPFQVVALTRGADGATLISASGERSDLPSEPAAVVNTVGAGDSYTAALAIGMLRGLSLEKTNAWANRVAAFVCTKPGASPNLPEYLHQPWNFT